MGFSVGRLAAPALLFVLGAAAMFAGLHQLWANLVLALLLGAWCLATIAVVAHRNARTPPAPVWPREIEAQAREHRRLTAYLNLSPAPLLTPLPPRALLPLSVSLRSVVVPPAAYKPPPEPLPPLPPLALLLLNVSSRSAEAARPDPAAPSSCC